MEVESEAEDGPEVSMNGVEGDPLDSGPVDTGPVDKERAPSEPAAPRTPPEFIYRIQEYRSYYEAIGLHWPEGDMNGN
jgi:hypothetical protein